MYTEGSLPRIASLSRRIDALFDGRRVEPELTALQPHLVPELFPDGEERATGANPSRDGSDESIFRHARGDNDRVLHPVQQFLVRRANGGQHAAQVRLAAVEEVIRAQPHPAAHGHDLAAGWVEVGMFDQPAFVKTLQEASGWCKTFQGAVDGALPFEMRQILRQIDPRLPQASSE